MQLVCDMVVTDIRSDVSKAGKQYYVFEGVIVGCPAFPVLSGIAVKKFISEQVFAELSTLTQDRFDCSVGISKTSANPRECDLAFNLFINGFPKEEEPAPEASGNVSPSPAPETANDKANKEGGKKV